MTVEFLRWNQQILSDHSVRLCGTLAYIAQINTSQPRWYNVNYTINQFDELDL